MFWKFEEMAIDSAVQLHIFSAGQDDKWLDLRSAQQKWEKTKKIPQQLKTSKECFFLICNFSKYF